MLEKSRKFPYKPHPKQREFFERETDTLWVGGHPTATFDVEKPMKGIVKNMPVNKSFCFIRGTNSAEYFLHKSDFNGNWEQLVTDFNEGNNTAVEVTFDVADTPKGPRASNCRRVD